MWRRYRLDPGFRQIGFGRSGEFHWFALWVWCWTTEPGDDW